MTENRIELAPAAFGGRIFVLQQSSAGNPIRTAVSRHKAEAGGLLEIRLTGG